MCSTQSISWVWYQTVARSSKTRLSWSPTATRRGRLWAIIRARIASRVLP